MEENNKLVPIATNSLVQKASISMAITNKLIEETNRKIIHEVFEKNLLFFIQIISKFYPINDDLWNKYDYLDWVELQNNENIDWDSLLIHKYQSKINYHYMYYTKIENKNIIPKRLDICINTKIRIREILNDGNIAWTNNFIEAYYNIWDWSQLSNNKKIDWSINLVDKYLDKWNWENLSKNDSLCWSDKFISKFKDKWNWDYMSSNKGISWNENLIINFKHYLNFNSLCHNTNVEWNENLITEFSELLNGEGLSHNKNFPWTKNLIEKKSKLIPLDILIFNISVNEKIDWDIDFLKKYELYLNWNILSINNSLPWSIELIEKYENKWDWDNLSNNTSIPWDILFLEKFGDKLNWGILSFNKSVNWSVNLISKYFLEIKCSSILWNIIKPYVDTDLINKIIKDNEISILSELEFLKHKYSE